MKRPFLQLVQKRGAFVDSRKGHQANGGIFRSSAENSGVKALNTSRPDIPVFSFQRFRFFTDFLDDLPAKLDRNSCLFPYG